MVPSHVMRLVFGLLFFGWGISYYTAVLLKGGGFWVLAGAGVVLGIGAGLIADAVRRLVKK